jgi:Flp pilus assembly protein TadD
MLVRSLLLASTLLAAAAAGASQAPQASPPAAGAPSAAASVESPAAIVARALAAQKDGRLEEAAEQYRRFLALVPRSWEARSNLGVVYAQLGRYDEAIVEYRGALEAGAGTPAVRHNLAIALVKAGRPVEAARELEGLRVSRPDDMAVALLLADCRLRMGEWKKVIEVLDPLLEKDPENPAILYLIGTALIRDRQTERGQRVLDRILRQGDAAEAHLLLALASREANDDIAAERELERALALNPRLPTANGMLGSVLMKMGEHDRAALAFERELSLNANDFESHLLLGAIRRQEFRLGEARRHLGRALELQPGDPGARFQLALADVAEGKIDAALATLEALVAEHPKFSEAHVSLASVYYRLKRKEDGDRQQAIVRALAAEKAAVTAPDQP